MVKYVVLPTSLPWRLKLFLACPPAVRKEQLFVIAHDILSGAVTTKKTTTFANASQKAVLLGAAHGLCLISPNSKAVIKSLFSLCSSRLHKPRSLDFHHRADFSDLLINSARFLWNRSGFCTMSATGTAGAGRAWPSPRVAFRPLHSFSSR